MKSWKNLEFYGYDMGKIFDLLLKYKLKFTFR